MAYDFDENEDDDDQVEEHNRNRSPEPLPPSSLRLISKQDSSSTLDMSLHLSKSAAVNQYSTVINSDLDVTNSGPKSIYGGSNHSIGKSVSFRNLYDDEPPRNHAKTSPLATDIPAQNNSPSKRQCWKNHLVVSLGFCLVYTSFNSLQNLASSLLTDDGLGFASLSIVYTMGICSCFFTPFLVKKLSPKWSIMIGYMAIFIFTSSILYPSYYTVLPASFLLGSVQGPLWTAAFMFITTAALDYAMITHNVHDHVVSKFTGIFLSFQQSSQVFGNVISSLVLQGGAVQLIGKNSTTTCGSNICPIDVTDDQADIITRTNASLTYLLIHNSSTFNRSENGSSNSPNLTDGNFKLYILGGLYLLFIAIAVMITGNLLDRFKMSRAAVENYGSHMSIASVVSQNLSSKDLLCASLHILTKHEMLLLLPISFAAGMQMAYIFADFTQNYVTCALGMNWVGYAMTAFGVVDMIFSYGIGEITKWIGRPVIFLLTSLIQLAMYLTMLFWYPDVGQIAVFFIVPALSGFCDAVWQPQIAAFIGILFKDQHESAIASHRMFFTLGSAVVFAYGNFICMYLKIYLGIALTILGVVSYGVAEFLYRRKLSVKEKKKIERKQLKNGVHAGAL